MRWTPGGRSRNLDDLRGQTGGGPMIGGRGMGIGGAVIALILSLVFGVNIFDGGGGGPVQTSPGAVDQPVTSTPQEEERMQFMSFILDDVQTTWAQLLPKIGEQYREAKLAVFRDGVSTACGDAPRHRRATACSTRARHRRHLDRVIFLGNLIRRDGLLLATRHSDNRPQACCHQPPAFHVFRFAHYFVVPKDKHL